MTTMTPDEILKEYEKDYPEIRGRMRNYLLANNRAFAARYKRTKNPLIEPKEPRTTVVNGSRYRVSLKITCGKAGFERFEMTVYQVLSDARTGKMRVWLLSTPNSTKKPFLLEFKTEFIKRLYPGLPIKEAIDSFMSQTMTYTLYEKPESETYKFEASFGDKLVGFGNIDGSRYIFERVYTFKEIEDIGDSLGLDGDQDPINVYNLWVKSKEKPEELTVLEDLSEEERKRKEIELAWKEYENV